MTKTKRIRKISNPSKLWGYRDGRREKLKIVITNT